MSQGDKDTAAGTPKQAPYFSSFKPGPAATPKFTSFEASVVNPGETERSDRKRKTARTEDDAQRHTRVSNERRRNEGSSEKPEVKTKTSASPVPRAEPQRGARDEIGQSSGVKLDREGFVKDTIGDLETAKYGRNRHVRVDYRRCFGASGGFFFGLRDG